MQKRQKKLLTVFLSLLFTAYVPLFGATAKLKETLGSKNYNLLNNAKFVTILPTPEEGKTPLREIHLNEREIQQLKRNLLDDHNFDFSVTKDCPLTPQLSLKFISENDDVLHLFINKDTHQILFCTTKQSQVLDFERASERLDYFFNSLLTAVSERGRAKS